MARVARPSGGPAGSGGAYQAVLARGEDDVRSAQQLRYQVFATEQGARLPSAADGLDVDGFDGVCDHLLVRDEATREVVGVYRLLPPGRSQQLVSDGLFELGAVTSLSGGLVEIGRACVHQGHRNGLVVLCLWAGVLRYMTDRGLRWLGGCASVPLADGGAQASAAWQTVRARHYAPAAYRVRPRTPWNPPDPGPCPPAAVPSLLRGYLMLGAWVCGPPALDSSFRTADLFTLLAVDRVPKSRLSPLQAVAS
ncbi:GNAT family N-acetyltransferase [Streptomyces sp. NPDC001262]|uniref:GNAT family N-acetyltransferase n=1 Tax=unclassified Streptomyces TaxID=2593676 RepID=UPI0036AA1B01